MMTDNLMGQSISQLRRWRKGQPVDHRQLNEPVDVLNDMTRGVGPPRQVMARVGGGVAVSAGGQFKLTESAADFPDHLVCRTWNGVTLGDTDIPVAKPWLLRQTPWDGQVRNGVLYEYSNGVTRTAYDNTDPTRQLNRAEQIHPRYLIGDVLNAIAADTGIEVIGENAAGEPIVVSVSMLDLNVDSRGWKTYYEWL